jgi:toxin ParE1/3/4
MNYEILLQSEAVIDIQDAFDWYELQRSGLGSEFMNEVEDGLEKLSRHPQHYSASTQKYRKLRIKRFPYLLIFEIEDLKVIINAVRRISQKPPK